MSSQSIQTRAVHREILALWLGTLLIIRVVYQLVQWGVLHEFFMTIAPLLFIYAPVALCNWRGVDSYDYPTALPAFRDHATWWRAVRLNLVVIGLMMVPWLIGYHFYQTLLFGFSFEGTLPGPWKFLQYVGYHLFFAAIPEEIFYRGYLQTRLDEVHPVRWRIFGADLGPGWLITCVLFAFGHSLVQFQWWHFAIFFPSLAFGWMRARTGGIIAGALFHAYCNIMVVVLDTMYGIVAP